MFVSAFTAVAGNKEVETEVVEEMETEVCCIALIKQIYIYKVKLYRVNFYNYLKAVTF